VRPDRLDQVAEWLEMSVQRRRRLRDRGERREEWARVLAEWKQSIESLVRLLRSHVAQLAEPLDPLRELVELLRE
jgi:phage shock protein A